VNIRSSSTAPAPIYPGDPPRRSRTTLLVVVFTLVALAAAAVVVVNLTKDDDGRVATATNRQEAPAASTPTTAADPQAATKAAIVAAYRQSFDAFVAVASDPNGSPDDPRLSQHKIGNALLASQISIKRLRDAGQISAGRVEVHPTDRKSVV
jgi:hypothetical protein